MSNKISIEQYIEKRLGENGNPLAQLKRMFVLSFTAYSFSRFWQYWNPVYGYYLYYYCFKPLRERLKLPYSISVLLTFILSGFLLHDLPSGWIIRQTKKEGFAGGIGNWLPMLRQQQEALIQNALKEERTVAFAPCYIIKYA